MKPASNKLIYGLVVVIVILLITSGISLISYQEQQELDQADLAKAMKESKMAAIEASKRLSEADRLTRLAEDLQVKAQKAQAEAEAARRDAEEKRLLADKASEAARISADKAKTIEVIALQERLQAEQEAEASRLAVTRLRYVAQGKVMALKSKELGRDAALEALIALQAYRFTQKFPDSLNAVDDDIYQGLFLALENLGGVSKPNDGGPGSTDLDRMASQICSRLTRNLTREEWSTFIGTDLPYERTCETLPAGKK